MVVDSGDTLLPQRHAVTARVPSVDVAKVVPISGANETTLLSISASPKPWAVTVINPLAVVLTVLAYLEPEAELVFSQPQPLAVTDIPVLDAA